MSSRRSLPVDELAEEFQERLRALPPGGRLVLTAPTGSGKSTRVPIWCRDALGGRGRVLVLEPRRLACRTLAGWVARAVGETVGGTVGYAVRFDQRQGPNTAVLFVTPGIARRMVVEGELDRFESVIFDEFHERGWESDTLLALLAAGRRPQRLVIMSATLESSKLAQRYGGELLEAQGRSYPVEIRYLGSAGEGTTVPTDRRLVERTVDAVQRVVRGPSSADQRGRTLVFLPGLAAMKEVQSRLKGWPVQLLHGTFGHSQQDQSFRGGEGDIILATNVAESSLTVPGVTAVIDSGLERRPIHQGGYVALATVPVAVSSAQQRAGRAGRTAPGVCWRMWEEQARLEAVRPPELGRMELDELLLFLSCLPEGVTTALEWFEEPPSFAWERALERLREQGLIDELGCATSRGRAVGGLPVETNWGRLLMGAPGELLGPLVQLCTLAQLRRPVWHRQPSQEQLSARRADLGAEPWRLWTQLLSWGDPQRHGLEQENFEQAQQLAADLWDGLSRVRKTPGEMRRESLGAEELEQLKLYLVEGWPQRVFVRRSQRQAWGNGSTECREARGGELPEEVEAAFFLTVDPVLGRGLRVELRARDGLPLRFSTLRQGGFGQLGLQKIRLGRERVTARVDWTYAGRVIASAEEELAGAPLRRALVELAERGAWQPGLWEQILEQHFYLKLAYELALQDRVEPPAEPTEFLADRLAQLGVESAQELSLLERSDLEWTELEAARLEQLRTEYPREFSFAGVAFDMQYRPNRKAVLMQWRSGPKGKRFNPQHLPRWNGWRVEVEERGTRSRLR